MCSGQGSMHPTSSLYLQFQQYMAAEAQSAVSESPSNVSGMQHYVFSVYFSCLLRSLPLRPSSNTIDDSLSLHSTDNGFAGAVAALHSPTRYPLTAPMEPTRCVLVAI